MKRPPFPFIVGCGRSGTTLLRAMLDSHEEMAIPPETRFVAELIERRAAYEAPGGFRREPFLRYLEGSPAYRRLEVGEALRQSFDRAAPADTTDAIRTVFALYAAANGKPRYGTKTPRDVISISELANAFPEATFVHIIRDGRAVALSFLSVDFGPPSITQAALQWDDFVRTGMAAGRTLGPERYREIRYEELVEDPERVLRQLCPLLALEYQPAMLRYHERHSELMKGVPKPVMFESLQRPPTQGMRDWRTQMTDRQVLLFEAIAGDLLQELGYPLSRERIALKDRAEAAVRVTSLKAWRGTVSAARRLGLRP